MKRKYRILTLILLPVIALFVAGGFLIAPFFKSEKEEHGIVTPTIPELSAEMVAAIADTNSKGGAVFLGGTRTSFTLNGGTISGSGAYKGGAVYISSGATFTMNSGTLTGNAAHQGGAIYVAAGGTCIINGGRIEGNTADQGAGIYCELGATLTIADGVEIGDKIFKGIELEVYVDDVSRGKYTVDAYDSMDVAAANYLPLNDSQCCGYFLDSNYTQGTYHYETIADLLKTYNISLIRTRTATLDILDQTQLAKGIVNAASSDIEGPVVIPRKNSNGQLVTSFVDATSYSEGSFYNCTKITSLIMPDSITSIGENAFYNCTALKGSLIIPRFTTSIGDCAFWSCSGLNTVYFPNGVTEIGSNAFRGCSGLGGYLTIPNSVTSMGAFAFEGCSGLLNVTISNKIAMIPLGAFMHCSGLRSINIPNGVTTIGESAFDSCSGATGSLTIPESVTIIGNNVFSGCTGLSGNLKFPNGLKAISDYAFWGCTGFTGSLNFPGSLTTLGYNAFKGCTGFTSVTIPSTVTSFGDYRGGYVFSGCTGLTSATIQDGITSLAKGLFYNCSGLVGEFTIPNSITTIGENAFYGCRGLTNIKLGSGVATIEPGAFIGCSGLTEMYIPKNVLTVLPANNTTTAPFYNSSSSLILYCEAASKPSGYGTYWNYYSNSIILTTYWGVTTAQYNSSDITINAYVDGSSSKTLKAKSAMTLDQIYAYMPLTDEQCCGYFANSDLTQDSYKYATLNSIPHSGSTLNLYTRTATLDKLDKTELAKGTAKGLPLWQDGVNYNGLLVIPRKYNGVLITKFYETGDYEGGAFADWTGLTAAYMPSSITKIGSYAFHSEQDYSSTLKLVNIHDCITEIGENAFFWESGLNNIVLPDGLVKIGASAFKGCEAISSITIPNSVTSIGIEAFAELKGLTSFVVSSGNANYTSRNNSGSQVNCLIEKSSKTLLQGFKNTTIPSDGSVVAIGAEAFAYVGIVSVTIPGVVKTIGEMAFQYCDKLQTLVIQNGATTIGDSAFYRCEQLQGTLNIPNSVTSMHSSAFAYCSTLSGVVLGSGLTEISDYCFNNCSKLTALTWQNSVKRIGDSAFRGCSQLGGSMIIPSGTTSIGRYAFSSTAIDSFWLPSSLTSITSSQYYDHPFAAKSSTVLYCEPSSKPSNWSTYFNNYNSSTKLTTYYGVSYSDFVNPHTLSVLDFTDNMIKSDSMMIGYTLSGNNMTLKYNARDIPYFEFIPSSSSDPYCETYMTAYLTAGVNYLFHGTVTNTYGTPLTTSGSVQIFYCLANGGGYSEAQSFRLSGEDYKTFSVGTSGTYKFRFDTDYGTQTIRMYNVIIAPAASLTSVQLLCGQTYSLPTFSAGTAEYITNGGAFYGTTSSLNGQTLRMGVKDAFYIAKYEFTVAGVNSSTYPFAYDHVNGYWYSTNGGKDGTTSSVTLYYQYGAADTLNFQYKYSSESNYDLMKVLSGSTELLTKSGTDITTTQYFSVDRMSAGDSIIVEYRKDVSNSYGQDKVMIWGLLTCFSIDTEILVWDDEKKRVVRKKAKDIKYTDKLLVWNFDKGCLDFAYPLFIQTHKSTEVYTEVKFSDGTVLDIAKDHAVFNVDLNRFCPVVSNFKRNGCPVGTRVMKDNGEIVTIVSKRRVHKPLTYTNIITNYHMNCYINGILSSTALNNCYEIKDMKFVKDDRHLEDLSKLDGISEEWIKGMRLDIIPDRVIERMMRRNLTYTSFKDYINEKLGNAK